MVKIDTQLKVMDVSVMKMANKVMRMHEKIIEVLRDKNSELALQIIQADDLINRLEEEINDEAVTSLALLSPVASDLRSIVANIKIASELERIGDYAKHVAIFMIKNNDVEDRVFDYAIEMEKQLIEMLQETFEAYQKRDVDACFTIPQMDMKINQLEKELHYSLVQTSDTFADVFRISTMLRNIERGGDHVKNICEHIIYMIKGQHYEFT